jgi:hypothetical protein
VIVGGMPQTSNCQLANCQIANMAVTHASIATYVLLV